MVGRWLFLAALPAVVLLSGHWCNDGTFIVENRDDAGVDGEAETGEPDVGRDARADAGDAQPPSSGPITLVGTSFEALTERLCDIDGDGVGDNAIADVGSPGADLLAAAISAMLEGSAYDEGMRWLAHAPLVDDLRGPSDSEVTVTFFTGVDDDSIDDDGLQTPANENWVDDFSGEEPFYVSGASLDACGESRSYLTSAALENGEIDGAIGQASFRIDQNNALLLRHGRANGRVEPFGTAGEFFLCGGLLVSELGATSSRGQWSDFSLLEIFVAGGQALGYPGLAGVSPDLDLDGDGLERLVLDDQGRIAECVDGDGSTIEGNDCWGDPRIADGFSIALRVTMTSARFAGRTPLWTAYQSGTCLSLVRCARVDGDECLDAAPCDETNSARADAFEACAAERCAGICTQGPDVGWRSCWQCASSECPDEAAACRESTCCDDPPATSLWDPV